MLSIMNAPLVTGGAVIGTLNVAIDKEGAYDEQDEEPSVESGIAELPFRLDFDLQLFSPLSQITEQVRQLFGSESLPTEFLG